MSVNFSISKNPGKVVIEADSFAKSFGDHKVFSDVNFTIERNAKIAFVGQNGQGKSTLAKAIVGDINYDGHLKLGHNVEIGYFAQNQAEYLDPNKTVLDTMIDSANESNRSKVRDILGAFLFRGDDVAKYVKVLSGGERNRLALAKMILAPFNVLIMDEPTNHLDIQSKNVLKQALANFEGTLILVSHDRDFLQGLAHTVYEFRNHKVKEFLGDINDYLKSRALENMRQVEQKSEEKSVVKSKNSPAQDYEIQKKYKKLSNKLSSIESNITKLENQIAVIDQKMAENYDKTVSQPDFFKNYKSLKSDLEQQLENWEKIQLQLDSIK